MDTSNMAAPKNPSPLIQIIRSGEGRDTSKLTLPTWAKPESQGGPSTGPEAPAEGGAGMQMAAWLHGRLEVRLTRGLIMLGMLAVAGMVTAGIWASHRMGYKAGLGKQVEYQALIQPMQEVRERPPVALIPSTVEGVAAAAGRPPDGVAGGDPRQPGLNYFRLTALPVASEAEAARAVAFLRENGVDAAVLPLQNGRSLKLVALPGFAKPLSDPAASQFEQRLKMLGRQWKQQQRGSSDWKDMFPEKYLPGKN